MSSLHSKTLAFTQQPILAIDTSCDDTSAAVVRDTVVLSNIVASQTQLHKPYGGVFPTIAKQAHRENIDRVIELALQRAQVEWHQLAAIAVTQGPGLAPALEVGVTRAQALADQHQLPLIAINHLEGHLLSVLAQPKPRDEQIKPVILKLPTLGIIVSGGHTEFILVKAIGEYERLGGTVDDAAGECLDKVGRMLSLGYPAGPIIEEMAKLGTAERFTFPLPMTTSGDFNLSFSGLKTAARIKIETLEAENQLDKQAVYDFCASFQNAVIRHIIHKLNKILQAYEVGEVWLGGGVAANQALRVAIRHLTHSLSATNRPQLKTPYTKRLCADNAAMIGVAASFAYQRKAFTTPQTLDRKPNLKLA